MFDDRCPPDAMAAAGGHRGGGGADPGRGRPGRPARQAAIWWCPSPGVPVGHPVFAAAAAAGVPVQAEIELAGPDGRRAPAVPRWSPSPAPTARPPSPPLVTAILQASGVRAVAAGNIGVPMIEAVTGGFEVVVAEVSSFQLQFTDTFRPAVSCWLNLAPDHLDWHPTLDHYAAAKARVWANQGAGDTAVFNADDPVVSRPRRRRSRRASTG